MAIERHPIIAEKNERRILVEVKTFGGRSFIRELEQAIGQYELYLDILELSKLEYELYLAISQFVYEEFFLRKGTHTIAQRHRLKLIVVDIEQEEITAWLSETALSNKP